LRSYLTLDTVVPHELDQLLDEFVITPITSA